MVIEYSDITGVMAKIKVFAADLKKPAKGILMECIDDETVRVAYADDKKFIVENVDMQLEEGEALFGKIIVPYEKVMSAMENCKPGGMIKVDSICMRVKTGNIFNIECNKYVEYATGNTVFNPETDEDEDEIIKKKAGHINTEFTYSVPGTDRSLAILTRADYSDAFSDRDSDTWDREELIKMLARLSRYEKRVYVTSKENAGFTVSDTMVMVIPNETVDSNGFILTAKAAKAVCDVLSRMDSDVVDVSVEESKYCYITEPEGKVAIWIMLAGYVENELVRLTSAQKQEYTDYVAVMNREVLGSAIANTMRSSKSSWAYLSFKKGEDKSYEMSIDSVDRNASESMDNSVILENSIVKEGNNMEDLKVRVNIQLLNDIMAVCNGFYIEFAVKEDADRKMVRVSDTDGRNEEGEREYNIFGYMVCGSE